MHTLRTRGREKRMRAQEGGLAKAHASQRPFGRSTDSLKLLFTGLWQ